MRALSFDDAFTRELPGDHGPPRTPRTVTGAAWSHAEPTPVRAPALLMAVPEVAALLVLDAADVQDPAFVDVLAGNRVLPGMRPFAACYGGHQFGNWAGQLGDGRAISLGALVVPNGAPQELQLKGAGLTPYSRRGDGRAVLRSSLRELLCSEAMHHLGVPTTRALSLVSTGEGVERDVLYDGNPKLEPGAIVCRVAPTFIRFGNFELPASRGDVPLLARLVDHTIAHHAPLEVRALVDVHERRAAWLADVCARTATLLAHWMRVGFVHGVMNTDNMSVLGLTIDYGPYGWVDDFDAHWTPNTTDAHGRRYRFGAQPDVAAWNLARLAEALVPLFVGDDGPGPAPLEAALATYAHTYAEQSRAMTAAKLGLRGLSDADVPFVTELFALLQDAGLDMTSFFRGLADVDPRAPASKLLASAFYEDDARAKHEPTLDAWLHTWAARVQHDDAEPAARRARMRRASPRYVLRNAWAHEAIRAAEAGDMSVAHELLEVLRRPYDDQPGKERWAGRRPDWARELVGASMLSCSS